MAASNVDFTVLVLGCSHAGLWKPEVGRGGWNAKLSASWVSIHASINCMGESHTDSC